ncbi:histone deacetylase complex subunit SAP30 isoform X1 [Falco peregrinus]|uniref:histone deacetylase complex subunit SAP30 isoform X1 n=1 Tax=Falco peregrinus TaxID=8954 RepID=UPI00247A7467|nr:histone deacetylase complex subunit SAP30 isoform X1 [Falco peregrinus]
MAPGALVCACSWRGQRSAAPPRVAMLHVSPCHSIFRSAAIRRRAARLGPAGRGGARHGSPGGAAAAVLRREAPGRCGVVPAFARSLGAGSSRCGGQSSLKCAAAGLAAPCPPGDPRSPRPPNAAPCGHCQESTQLGNSGPVRAWEIPQSVQTPAKARHLYICDFHKNLIQSVRNRRKRKGSDDDGDSPVQDIDTPEVDLYQLQVNTLRRYKRHFKLQTRPGLNKAQLVEIIGCHFRTIPVNEKDTLTYFIYSVKNDKNKPDLKMDSGVH